MRPVLPFSEALLRQTAILLPKCLRREPRILDLNRLAQIHVRHELGREAKPPERRLTRLEQLRLEREQAKKQADEAEKAKAKPAPPPAPAKK